MCYNFLFLSCLFIAYCFFFSSSLIYGQTIFLKRLFVIITGEIFTRKMLLLEYNINHNYNLNDFVYALRSLKITEITLY